MLTRSDTPRSDVGHVLGTVGRFCTAGARRGSLGGMRAQLLEAPDLELERPRAKVWFAFDEDEEPEGSNVIVELEGSEEPFDPGVLMWHVVSVTIATAVPGWTVTPTMLRQIRLGELATQAMQLITPHAIRFVDRYEPEITLAGRIGGKEERTFELVGGVYEDELRRGGKPVQTIAEAFGVSRGTATRWVRKARDLGYISALESERSGGK